MCLAAMPGPHVDNFYSAMSMESVWPRMPNHHRLSIKYHQDTLVTLLHSNNFLASYGSALSRTTAADRLQRAYMHLFLLPTHRPTQKTIEYQAACILILAGHSALSEPPGNTCCVYPCCCLEGWHCRASVVQPLSTSSCNAADLYLPATSNAHLRYWTSAASTERPSLPVRC